MGRLRASGGYRELRSFQSATLIYDATVWFCERFVDHRSRLVDQMVQAARSGRQNIAEGSRASATSSQTELRLTNVARSSLEELLLDFEDYLRQRRLKQWRPDAPDAQAVRSLAAKAGLKDPSDPSDMTNHDLYAPWIEHAQAPVRANALICLIHQTNYLLDQQIEALEKAFIEDGGYSEALATARLVERGRKTSDKIPTCPQCGKLMVLRTAHQGEHEGKQFWGCSSYPSCTGTRRV
jgi:four helix bundle suffix protein